MFLSIGMLKLNYFLADIFILSAEKQPIKLSWRKIECLHEYGDGRKIPNVKLYPNELLPDFREHFNNEWLLQRAEQYFSKKDIKAIPYLQKNGTSITKNSEM